MCSFTLGHWMIPFLSILVVQIGTMKCFYCPQKDTSVVPWDSWSADDQMTMSPDDQMTSTLMLVRGPFVTCVFALHAPVRSSAALLQAPHRQPHNPWILRCRCLWVL